MKDSTISLTISAPVFKTMVLGTGILATKVICTNIYSAFPAAFSGCLQEDSWMWKQFFGVKHDQHHGAQSHQHDSQARSALLRAQRVVMNDLENIPIALIVFWMAAFSNPKASHYVGSLFSIFVGARVAHSCVYLAGVGGGVRSLCYSVGTTCTFRALFLGLKGVGFCPIFK